MADKNFGIKQLNLIGASGTPTITSPNNLNLNAVNVSISTDLTIGGKILSNVFSLGIVTATGGFNIGIQSAGVNVTTGVITALNFIGSGNTFFYDSSSKTVAISIAAGGSSQWVTTAAGINTSSNVGIGITNPTSTLHVVGNARVSGVITATSFIGDGSGLNNIVATGSGVVIRDDGNLVGTAATIDFGTNLSVSPISAGIVTISTIDLVSSQWVTTASGINTSSNVGIGTTNPTSKLDVFGGNIRASGTTAPSLIIVPTSGSSYIVGANTTITGSGIYDNTAGVWRLVVKDTTGNILIGSTSESGTASQKLQVTGGASFTGTGSNVGIGTTNPQSKLHVEGSLLLATNGNGLAISDSDIIRSNGNLFLRGGGPQSTRNNITLTNGLGIIIDGGSGETYGVELKGGNGNIKVTQGNLLVGTTTATGTASQLLQVSGGAAFYGTGSNVGIGTTNPQATLDVRGNVNISGNLNAAGNYYVKLARLTNQTIPAGTDTLIGFTATSDTNGWYSGITTRTTPTVAGNYYVSAMLNWQPGATTNTVQSNIQLRKNGNTFAINIVGIQTFQYSQFAYGIVAMNGTTDYIEFTAYTSNATSQAVTGDAGASYTKMEIFKIN